MSHEQSIGNVVKVPEIVGKVSEIVVTFSVPPLFPLSPNNCQQQQPSQPPLAPHLGCRESGSALYAYLYEDGCVRCFCSKEHHILQHLSALTWYKTRDDLHNFLRQDNGELKLLHWYLHHASAKTSLFALHQHRANCGTLQH